MLKKVKKIVGNLRIYRHNIFLCFCVFATMREALRSCEATVDHAGTKRDVDCNGVTQCNQV